VINQALMQQYQVLCQKIDYTFEDGDLLQRALTHRSYSGNNNERLEFLGDGVLNFIIAHQLFKRFAGLSEGDLSRLRAQLVKEATLADIAFSLNLGDLLKMGEGELKSAGWRRPSIVSDALEAIIGAAYLDGGFDSAQAVVLHLYADKLKTIDPKIIDKDAKSQLQEFLQGKKIDLPDYQVIAIEGEAHAQNFTVACEIKALNVITKGDGTSRRNAEQQAAQLALEKITQ
jgi:ribonuclease III